MSSTSATSTIITSAGISQGVSSITPPTQSSTVNVKEKDGKDATNTNSKNSTAKKKKTTTGAATAGVTSVPTNSKVYFWQSECKYSVIIDRVKELDWKLVEGEKYESRVNLIWVDVSTIHEHFRNIQPWQMINHFPGMPNIARKNRMGQNLNKMLKIFPKEYSFYPKTWILPSEMVDFRQQFDSSGNSIGNKIYIIKPDAGCQGRGIFLTRTIENVPTQENVVAQVYIKKPLLLDGFKFDLRLYCLVTSVRPLRMYLFQDGLVRMCTEEYVKPTKQNISNVCMHLTNYAVNKHNENFVQPSAASSEESQEGDSKRSLLWFMNFIRKEHGDSKADWLWQRMGILCTRTILSIMPTLSREYEQHFKSFNSVPVDISKIPTNGYNSAAANSSDSGSESATEKQQDGETRAPGESGGAKEEKDEDNKTPRTPKIRGSRCFEILGFDIMIDSNLKPWIIEVNHLPSFGTDSLLDKDIKERLMEQVFNVLPVMPDDQQAYMAHHKAESEKRLSRSKTTEVVAKAAAKPANDKPVARLRSTVSSGAKFSDTSSVTGKRDKTISTGGNSTDKLNKPNGFGSSASNISLGSSAASNAAQSQQQEPQQADDSAGNKQLGEENDSDLIFEDCTPERLQEIKTILIQIYQKYSPEKTSKIDRLLAKYQGHEEEFLRFVYAKYDVKPEHRVGLNGSGSNSSHDSPTGGTSSSTPPPVEGTGFGIAEAAQLAEQESNGYNGEEEQGDNDQDEGNDIIDNGDNQNEYDFDNSSMVNEGSVYETSQNENSEQGLTPHGNDHPNGVGGSSSSQPKPPASNTGNNSIREQRSQPKMRFSRSVSPPRSTTPHGNRRAPAAWKVVSAEEDIAFRAEVLAAHVPDETEEWMQLEMSRLSQFTRIFPAGDPRYKSKGQASEDIDRDEDNDNDDNEEGEEKEKDKEKDGKDKEKSTNSASYEDILFQVFTMDRRQTMRLHCPLPNRGLEKDGNGSTLPLIDSSINSSRTSSSTMSSNGKGVVGWKAPPKPVRKEVARQPTQTQADAAKRLSQGLSVSASAQRDAAIRQRNSGISNNFFQYNSHFGSYAPNGLILDPHEYPQQLYMNNIMGTVSMNGGPNAFNNADNISLGGFDLQQDTGLPSTKSAKLIEECRLNRMRLEAVRQANNAAVLRQQVFHFDPNYYPYLNAVGGADPGNANFTGIPGAGQPAVGVAAGQLAVAASSTHSNMAGYAQDLHANNSMGKGVAAAPSNGTGVAPSITSGMNIGAGLSQKHRGAVSASNPSITHHHSAHAAHTTSSATAMKGPLSLNGSGAANPNGGDHSQEELLKQLFPSWF